MKIEFDEKQYNALIRLVFLGRQMMEYVNEEESDEALIDNEYEALEQYILSFFKNFGADDCVEFSAKHKAFFTTRAFEDAMQPVIDSYDDWRFWEELEDRLSARDLVEKVGPETAEKLEFEERYKMMESISQRYEEEFVENGIQNLILKDRCNCKDH